MKQLERKQIHFCARREMLKIAKQLDFYHYFFSIFFCTVYPVDYYIIYFFLNLIYVFITGTTILFYFI